MNPQEPWHLSKSVPVTLIFAIVCQTVALIWFVASLSNDVAANKLLNAKQDAKIESLEAVVQNQAVTMARMDENIKSIRELLEAMATRFNSPR
jgi:uncharacterized coiled-coil protein SlyX